MVAPSPHSQLWRWELHKHLVAMGDGKASPSDNPPANPVSGSFWLETDTGNLFVWWDDGNSQQWVQVNVGAGSMGPQGVQGVTGATGPTGPPGPWTQITQAAYNALSPPNPTVLYVIIG